MQQQKSIQETKPMMNESNDHHCHL